MNVVMGGWVWTLYPIVKAQDGPLHHWNSHLASQHSPKFVLLCLLHHRIPCDQTISFWAFIGACWWVLPVPFPVHQCFMWEYIIKQGLLSSNFGGHSFQIGTAAHVSEQEVSISLDKGSGSLALLSIQAVCVPRLMILTRRFFSSLSRCKMDNYVGGAQHCVLGKQVCIFFWMGYQLGVWWKSAKIN